MRAETHPTFDTGAPRKRRDERTDDEQAEAVRDRRRVAVAALGAVVVSGVIVLLAKWNVIIF